MQSIIIDLVLFGFVYAILMAFIFIRSSRRRKDNDDGDDEGGLPVSLPPDIDLPPGVCLPDDKPRKTVREPGDVFA